MIFHRKEDIFPGTYYQIGICSSGNITISIILIDQ